MNRFRDQPLARVGIIGLVSVIAVILTGLQFGKVWLLDSGITFSAVFDDAGGLNVGDDVTLSGITVGEVTGIELVDGRATAEFTVDGNVVLGELTGVEIKTSSFLGKRELLVTSDGDGRLRPGDVIPVDRTGSPYSLTDALQGVTTTVADTDTDSLNAALNTLSSTLDQSSDRFGPTFDGLTRLSTTLNARDADLRGLLESAGDVTDVLAQRSNQVNAMILNANELLLALDQRKDAISGLIANIGRVSDELNGLVADNEATLRPTLDQLSEFMDVLIANRDNIAQMLPGLAKYSTALGEAVGTGPWYNAYLPNLLPGPLLQPFINKAFGLPDQPFPIPGDPNTPVPSPDPFSRGSYETGPFR